MFTLILAQVTENSTTWVEILGYVSAVLETFISGFYTLKAIVNKIRDTLIDRELKKDKKNNDTNL